MLAKQGSQAFFFDHVLYGGIFFREDVCYAHCEKTGTLYHRASGSFLVSSGLFSVVSARGGRKLFASVWVFQTGVLSHMCRYCKCKKLAVPCLDGAGHWQVGSLAGVAHLLKCNTGVLRAAP